MNETTIVCSSNGKVPLEFRNEIRQRISVHRLEVNSLWRRVPEQSNFFSKRYDDVFIVT